MKETTPETPICGPSISLGTLTGPSSFSLAGAAPQLKKGKNPENRDPPDPPSHSLRFGFLKGFSAAERKGTNPWNSETRPFHILVINPRNTDLRFFYIHRDPH